VIECPVDSTDLKPDPGMLKRVLTALDISPDRAVLVGDSTNDVRAGKAAGVKVCAVGYGYGDLERIRALEPDFYCEQPEDLISLLGTEFADSGSATFPPL
jgi:phosphoglycolate phosphatase